MSTYPLDQMVADQFRQAMRHLAATVTIVSTEADGTRYGMTATAVTSVSMEPPSILAAVNKRNWFHQHVSRKGAFASTSSVLRTHANARHSEEKLITTNASSRLIGALGYDRYPISPDLKRPFSAWLTRRSTMELIRSLSGWSSIS